MVRSLDSRGQQGTIPGHWLIAFATPELHHLRCRPSIACAMMNESLLHDERLLWTMGCPEDGVPRHGSPENGVPEDGSPEYGVASAWGPLRMGSPDNGSPEDAVS